MKKNLIIFVLFFIKIMISFFVFYLIFLFFLPKNVINIYNFSWKNIDFELKINKEIFYKIDLENKNFSKINLKEKWYFEWRLSIFIDKKVNILSGYYWLYCLQNFQIFVFENKIIKLKLFPNLC